MTVVPLMWQDVQVTTATDDKQVINFDETAWSIHRPSIKGRPSNKTNESMPAKIVVCFPSVQVSLSTVSYSACWSHILTELVLNKKTNNFSSLWKPFRENNSAAHFSRPRSGIPHTLLKHHDVSGVQNSLLQFAAADGKTATNPEIISTNIHLLLHPRGVLYYGKRGGEWRLGGKEQIIPWPASLFTWFLFRQLKLILSPARVEMPWTWSAVLRNRSWDFCSLLPFSLTRSYGGQRACLLGSLAVPRLRQPGCAIIPQRCSLRCVLHPSCPRPWDKGYVLKGTLVTMAWLESEWSLAPARAGSRDPESLQINADGKSPYGGHRAMCTNIIQQVMVLITATTTHLPWLIKRAFVKDKWRAWRPVASNSRVCRGQVLGRSWGVNRMLNAKQAATVLTLHCQINC